MHSEQLLQEAPPEQARQHPHRQEEPRPARHPGLAVGREPAARHDGVHMRVVRQRRAPGVQHQRGADARAQVLGVCSDGQQYLGSQVEQQAVHHGLVLVRDVGDGRGQREDDVVVLHRQQIGLPGFQPTLGRMTLALRAVAVAAGVVGHLIGTAATAAQDMATQRRAAALLDGRHDLELAQAQVAALRGAPGGSMNTKDVGNLQGGLHHDASLRRAAGSPAG